MFFFLRPSPEPSGSCLQSWFSLQLIFITPLQSFENGQALILVVFRFLFATYPQPFFPLFSVYEALFALTLQVRRATSPGEFIRVVCRATIVALPRKSLFTSISRGLRKQLKAVLQELVAAAFFLAMPPIITLPPVVILLKNLFVFGKSNFVP